MINEKDISIIRSKMSIYGTPLYNAVYDFNANKIINSVDIGLVRFIFGSYITIYKGAETWLND
jgi:hypothetical protein